jgi:gluconokinase
VHPHFLGVDIGTSGTKAVLFDYQGLQIHRAVRPYALTISNNGKAELDPNTVFSACLEAVQETASICGNNTTLAGIGFASQMHSLMAIDSQGEPLTALMTWADTRAEEEARFIAENFDIESLYKKTGCRAYHPIYPLAKILWLKRHRQDITSKIWKYITIKEYILYKLTGDLAVDVTSASSQGYFNTTDRRWDEGICLDVLETDLSFFPEIRECATVTAPLKNEYRVFLGLSEDVTITLGTGDGIAAHIGCGIRDEMGVSSTVGTSGALRKLTKRPTFDPQQRTWCYAYTGDTWVTGGAINNGGLVLSWLLERFGREYAGGPNTEIEDQYTLINRYAGEIPPGSDGLLFLPLLTGERSPNWRSDLRGSLFGLDYHHDKRHILRAALEGVMFRMFAVYEILDQEPEPSNPIIANGGYIHSEVWLQIQADIFGRKISIPKTKNATALGAAFLSMVSGGYISSEGEILPGMAVEKEVLPDDQRHREYQLLYRKHLRVYDAMAGV